MDKDFALAYGILAGDGCLSKVGRAHFISLTCSIKDDEPFMRDIAVPLLEKLRERTVKYRRREKYGKIEINFSDKSLFHKFRDSGFPVGKKDGIDIPDMISDNLLKYFISGYFSTDGSIVLANNNGSLYPRIEIQSKSRITVDKMCNFLNKNGIRCRTYRMERNSGRDKGRIMYRMQANGKENLLKFREIIGFINPKHEKRFQGYMPRWLSG
jgi:hypothetical protein